MTGIELIAQERKEQIEKHGRTVELDAMQYNNFELRVVARALMTDGVNFISEDQPLARLSMMPPWWNRKVSKKMVSKPYKERLIIAGALIAAEIDRLQYADSGQKNREDV